MALLISTRLLYQTDTRRDLPSYQITILLVYDVILIFVNLLNDLILGFSYSNLSLILDTIYHLILSLIYLCLCPSLVYLFCMYVIFFPLAASFSFSLITKPH